MAGGFRLHGLFEGFWSSTPSTITGGDVCGCQTCSMLMAKVLFDREISKDKNRWRCFQGYQGDIGCPTGESYRIPMIFGYIRVLLRQWYKGVIYRQGFSGMYEISVGSE
jgi:hypothetical protein